MKGGRTMRRALAVLAVIAAAASCKSPDFFSPPGGGPPGDDDATTSGTPVESPTPDPDPPTYYEDVLPVVMARCQSCHTTGGAAVAIDLYANAFPRSALIADYTAMRALPTDPVAGPFTGNPRMPPWPPEETCGQNYKNPRMTTVAERDLF